MAPNTSSSTNGSTNGSTSGGASRRTGTAHAMESPKPVEENAAAAASGASAAPATPAPAPATAAPTAPPAARLAAAAEAAAATATPPPTSSLTFLLNGTPVTLRNPDPHATLLSFLRDHARLKGTKAACHQGGCGSCTVLLAPWPEFASSSASPSAPPSASASASVRSGGAGAGAGGGGRGGGGVPVNACLRPLCSVNGMAVTTVEGVGSVHRCPPGGSSNSSTAEEEGQLEGLHPVQRKLVEHNGSQCGFCTSGFVMTMYGLLQSESEPSAARVEAQLDGNLCRCTGYRPILDAFHELSCCGSGGSCRSKLQQQQQQQQQSEEGLSAALSSLSSLSSSTDLPCKSRDVSCRSYGGVAAAACGPEIEDLCASTGRCLKLSSSPSMVEAGCTGSGAAAGEGCAPTAAAGAAPGGRGAVKPAHALMKHPSAPAVRLRVVRRSIDDGSSSTSSSSVGGDDNDGIGRDRVEWVTAASLEELFSVLQEHADDPSAVRIVAGNTGVGVYPPLRPTASVLLDISRVPELQVVRVTAPPSPPPPPSIAGDTTGSASSSSKARKKAVSACAAAAAATGGVTVGAAVTLNELISVLETNSALSPGTYPALADHLKKVANQQVRNAGTVAGNLVLARTHPGFPSDVALVLAAVGATVAFAAAASSRTGVAVTRAGVLPFLRRQCVETAANGDDVVLLSVHIPSCGSAPPPPPTPSLPPPAPAAPAATAAAATASAAGLGSGIHGGGPGAKEAAAAAATASGEAEKVEEAGGWSAQLVTFKVAKRSVNSHAIVNAAFLLWSDSKTGTLGTGAHAPVLVFGGVSHQPVRASRTEAFLAGKRVWDAQVMQQALSTLVLEVQPEPSLGKVEYKALLLRSLLYKGLLRIIPAAALAPDLATAAVPFKRPVSRGMVSFDEGDASTYPVSKPVHKLSEAIQTTGEAVYLDDMDHAGQLHARLVCATVANAAVAAIDASKALALPGVVDFLSAAHLPSLGFSNNVTEDEELFASSRVIFYGQPVGIVIATSHEAAYAAANAVKVTYTDVQTPLLSIDDAVAADSFFPNAKRELKTGSMEQALAEADLVVEGETQANHQYHFHLETQRAVCVPQEDGHLTVYSSTQNPSLIQSVVSSGIGTPSHKVKVVVKRVGGAYGAKLNRCAPTAMACAVAARKLNRPVRLVLDLSTNMQIAGGRSPYRCSYKVAVTKDGLVKSIQMRVLNNHGAHIDFEYPEMLAFLLFVDNVYNVAAWDVVVECLRTNLPASTWIRAPGNVESLFMTETIMEHVAAAVGLPVEEVRERNLYRVGDLTPTGQQLSYCNARLVIDSVKASSKYEERRAAVAAFNASSRWVKRGLCLVPCKYVMPWEGLSFTALVNVYPDGSVSIQQAGCELGQGLYVKVAQTAALSLGQLTSDGCALRRIVVKDTNTDVAVTCTATGGSITSELCSMATQKACQEIVQRLQPIAAMLHANKEKAPGAAAAAPTWDELIAAATQAGVDLQARGRVHPAASGRGPSQYVSFGAGVTEAEVDMLTGEWRLLRSDLLLDCGKSLNPAVDIGQVQGAFVMGLGYMLTEELEYDRQSGKLLTDSTWEYKPLTYADIPIDLRASLLQNSGNPHGFLRSKASGEPPLAMAISALLAIRQALVAGKEEVKRRKATLTGTSAGNEATPNSDIDGGCVSSCGGGGGGSGSLNDGKAGDWVALTAPATVEKVGLVASVPAELLLP